MSLYLNLKEEVARKKAIRDKQADYQQELMENEKGHEVPDYWMELLTKLEFHIQNLLQIGDEEGWVTMQQEHEVEELNKLVLEGKNSYQSLSNKI